MRTLRVSSLPLAFKCAASLQPMRIAINESHPAASDGTAAHDALRALPTVGIQWDAIPAVAAKHGADAREVRMLVALGVKLWNQVKDSFAGALTEQRLEYQLDSEFTLVGHADLIAIALNAVRVGDYKTGRKDADYHHQIVGYAALGLLVSEGVNEATGTLLWVREQEIENWTLDRAAALAWIEELRRVLDDRDTHRPGSHCAHCPRNIECEAANALVRRDLAVIADKSLVAQVEGEIARMTDAQIVDAFKKADLVVKFCERIRAAIKAHVERTGDVEANGVRLTLTSENRREIDPMLAWPVLERLGFSDVDFARAMVLRASALEDIAAEKAGKGNGARAKRELAKALADAGAVKINTINKLAEKRTA